jgi:hypothetical protein
MHLTGSERPTPARVEADDVELVGDLGRQPAERLPEGEVDAVSMPEPPGPPG